jgi:hypothetical protein
MQLSLLKLTWSPFQLLIQNTRYGLTLVALASSSKMNDEMIHILYQKHILDSSSGV